MNLNLGLGFHLPTEEQLWKLDDRKLKVPQQRSSIGCHLQGSKKRPKQRGLPCVSKEFTPGLKCDEIDQWIWGMEWTCETH